MVAKIYILFFLQSLDLNSNLSNVMDWFKINSVKANQGKVQYW